MKDSPDACTRVPGAWPAIRILAVEDGESTGRGSCGSGRPQRPVATDASGPDGPRPALRARPPSAAQAPALAAPSAPHASAAHGTSPSGTSMRAGFMKSIAIMPVMFGDGIGLAGGIFIVPEMAVEKARNATAFGLFASPHSAICGTSHSFIAG